MLPLEKPFKKAVILGAGGFIGINLAHTLVAQGFDLVCFDRAISPHWPEKATVLIGDFASMPVELLHQLDHALVFHLISSCRPSPNTANAAEEVSYDVATTLRYLEHTRGKNVRWVFVSSGGTVYGPNVPSPTSEDAPTNPICSYGLIKLTLEKYFALYKKLHGTDFVVARVSNPYGPWQDPLRGQGVIAALIYKAMTGQPVEIWGDGENIRDYLYIKDAISGLIELARHGESGAIYNVSSGEGTTINELIEVISRSLGIPPKTNYVTARMSDVRTSILDSSKLRALTGWQPESRLEDGIRNTALWISRQLNQETGRSRLITQLSELN